MDEIIKEVDAQTYIELNQKYLDKEKELEAKIKDDLKNNPDCYPSNAEELYYFDYAKEITEEDEDKLVLLESVITDRFKSDYEELDSLRETIIQHVGRVVFGTSEVTPSEN